MCFLKAGAAALALGASWVFAEEPPTVLELNPLSGAPSRLEVGGQTLALQGTGGGFSVEDFEEKRPLALSAGKVLSKDGGRVYTVHAGDVVLAATFAPEKGAIRVSGEVKNPRGDERALVVRYEVPLALTEDVFQSDLSQSVIIGKDKSGLGTVYPLGALTGKEGGLALAIPPSFPTCFGVKGSPQGLAIEFYLGVVPDTVAFPNSARFEFYIFPAEAKWGFRSALATYYATFPEFYKRKFEGAGFWNWQEKGDIDYALNLFRYQGIPRGRTFQQDLDRNKRLGLLTFDYVIVGQREIRDLPTLPKNYEEVIAELARLSATWKEDPKAFAQKNAHWRDRDLPLLIESSAVTEADGNFRFRARETTWGKNSLTFTINPNPDLFKDKDIPTVGATTLETIRGWYANDPIDGIMIDSLGNQWPSTLNFRKDHFPYARYPLTFDEEGRVALHNQVSHYEFVESLRHLSDENHKLLFANGITRYASPQPEHYNGKENGRFFLAALLDTAGREITATLDRDVLEFFRACMGTKLFTVLLYKWNDPHEVKRQMNRALVYDVFAGPLRCFLDDVSYLKSQDGYFRDKDLLEWFVAQARTLHEAGWQPVTYATTDRPEVAIERYGEGDVVYFAISNFGFAPVEAEVRIDLAALKMSPQSGEMSHIREVAHGLKVSDSTEGNINIVKLKLAPDEAHILKLSRAW